MGQPYGMMVRRTWNGRDFRQLSVLEKLLLIYLWTCENGAGRGPIFLIPMETMSSDLNVPIKAIKKAISTLTKSIWIDYDSKSRVIWLTRQMDVEQTDNMNVLKGLISKYKTLPRNPFETRFRESILLKASEMGVDLKVAVDLLSDETPSKPLRNPFETPSKQSRTPNPNPDPEPNPEEEDNIALVETSARERLADSDQETEVWIDSGEGQGGKVALERESRGKIATTDQVPVGGAAVRLSDHTVFTRFWCDELYPKKFPGLKYAYTGKDAALVKKLTVTYNLEHLQLFAHSFFSDPPDDFADTAGFTIGVFSSQINKIVQRLWKKSKQLRDAQNYQETQRTKQIEQDVPPEPYGDELAQATVSCLLRNPTFTPEELDAEIRKSYPHVSTDIREREVAAVRAIREKQKGAKT